MQELEQMISIYHTAFIVCLILGILFLLITVFLFFKFDIRKIFDMKTGRGAKRSIQKMEEINARTGKLRQDMVPYTPLRLKPEERITYPVTAANPTAPGPGQSEGSQETVSLYQTPETTILSESMTKEDQQRKREFPGAFKIEKEIIWVHTKEVL